MGTGAEPAHATKFSARISDCLKKNDSRPAVSARCNRERARRKNRRNSTAISRIFRRTKAANAPAHAAATDRLVHSLSLMVCSIIKRWTIGVEAPVQQGAVSKTYSRYFEKSQRRWAGWIDAEIDLVIIEQTLSVRNKTSRSFFTACPSDGSCSSTRRESRWARDVRERARCPRHDGPSRRRGCRLGFARVGLFWLLSQR